MLSLAQNAAYLRRLNDIGIALSAEHNLDRLLEMILTKAKDICNADAGILFVLDDRTRLLHAKVTRCDTLGIHTGGTTGKPVPNDPVPLYGIDKKPRHESITARSALTGESIHVPDIYCASNYDFTASRAFDKKNNYKTVSVLSVPMKNKRKEVLGVLRLSNARDASGTPIPFSEDIQHFVGSLASQAAVALDNDLLLGGLEELLEAFIKLVAMAIDRKSPHTGGHCEKVPFIAEALTRAACEATEGALKDFTLTDEEMYEVRIGAWMHDCGKLTTPDYILEKGRKLEAFCDRIELIRTRLEVTRRDAEITMLKAKNRKKAQADYKKTLKQIEADWSFLQQLNQGSEWVDDAAMAELERIAKTRWSPTVGRKGKAKKEPFFTKDELEHLSVRRGTLTAKDRKIIMDHVVATIEMLETLPFPRSLRRVPEYAGGHHEKINGTGYPKGLKGHEMSIPARIMAIADIFEALTSSDRPYKKAKTLSETFRIMDRMEAEGEIDPDLYDLLKSSKAYLPFAQKYLKPEQRDIG